MKSLLFFLGAFFFGGYAYAHPLNYICVADLTGSAVTISVINPDQISVSVGGKTYLGRLTQPKYSDEYIHFAVDENQSAPQIEEDALMTKVRIRPWMLNGSVDDTRPGESSALIDFTVLSGYSAGSHVAFYTCKRSF